VTAWARPVDFPICRVESHSPARRAADGAGALNRIATRRVTAFKLSEKRVPRFVGAASRGDRTRSKTRPYSWRKQIAARHGAHVHALLNGNDAAQGNELRSPRRALMAVHWERGPLARLRAGHPRPWHDINPSNLPFPND